MGSEILLPSGWYSTPLTLGKQWIATSEAQAARHPKVPAQFEAALPARLLMLLSMQFSRSGGTGRRSRLKICRGSLPVWVRLPPPGPSSAPALQYFLPLDASGSPRQTVSKWRSPMSSLSSNLAPMSNRRRSQRVLLRIPIAMIASGADKENGSLADSYPGCECTRRSDRSGSSGARRPSRYPAESRNQRGADLPYPPRESQARKEGRGWYRIPEAGA
jgi:hypothetical protein